MFSRHILAVLPLLLLTALAEVDLQVGARDMAAEPRSPSDNQSSASQVISSLLAATTSDATSHAPSKVSATSTSTSSSTPTQLSSTTSSPTDSTSQVIRVVPTSPGASSPSSSSSLSSTTAVSAPISSSSSSSTDDRKQAIILAVCFAGLGFILLTTTLILIHRYRSRKSPFSPFSRRGASPIDDDEIATWRGNVRPMAKTPSKHVRDASSVVFQPYPGWSWDVSSSPDLSSTSPPSSGGALLNPAPPPVAHAPNARSGLTDGVVPGAAPFVTTARRTSRRLSKVASVSHIRNKSRRSSASVSSIPEPRISISNGQWREPDDWDVQRKRSSSGPRASRTGVGRASMGDDMRFGGLSPRPIPGTNLPPSEIPGSAY